MACHYRHPEPSCAVRVAPTGLPGTDLPSYCKPKYTYNVVNIASYALNGWTMQNSYVRASR